MPTYSPRTCPPPRSRHRDSHPPTHRDRVILASNEDTPRPDAYRVVVVVVVVEPIHTKRKKKKKKENRKTEKRVARQTRESLLRAGRSASSFEDGERTKRDAPRTVVHARTRDSRTRRGAVRTRTNHPTKRPRVSSACFFPRREVEKLTAHRVWRDGVSKDWHAIRFDRRPPSWRGRARRRERRARRRHATRRAISP